MVVSAGVALAAIGAAYAIYVKRRGEPARALRGADSRRSTGRSRESTTSTNSTAGSSSAASSRSAGSRTGSTGASSTGWSTAPPAWRAASRAWPSLFDEGVVDGAVNGIGRVHLDASSVLRRLQTGRIYNYALAVVLGVALVITIAVAVF